MKQTLNVVFLFASVSLLAACGSHEPAAPAAPGVDGERVIFPADSVQQKGLVSIPAELKNEDVLRVSGRVVWNETRTTRIFAPVAGRVLKLVAEPGQKVKAGDVLALLSSPDFGVAQVEAAKAAADFGVAEKSLDRARQLNKAGIMADKDLQQAEAEFARASAERNRTLARNRALGVSGSTADQQLALRSPITGVVVERNVNPGQEVRPDQAQPGSPALFVVSDPDRLWINLDLPEAALGVIRTGAELTLTATTLPTEKLTAKIEHVADFIDPTTRATRARASVDNKARLLKAEMFVNADIPVKREPFIRLPATAVILLGQTQYVFIDEGEGKYRRQAVQAEEAGFGAMRIKQGIKANEKVVTEGALLLQQIIATTAVVAVPATPVIAATAAKPAK